MALTQEEVAHLAHLARIEMSEAELQRLAPQLDVILDAVAAVTDIAADDVPATSHALPITNVMRPDVNSPSLAPQEQQRFRVPQILGEEA
ncbi:MAG: Asp-tRNA(Asn)/Glu-tRNA(Gln) amidotransferase GatCAB subunit C [Propionibacteriales bacterium]|nr:MAG: Asp-tRNA(Asn)/Glu-tRNA(Gln) amidotransferase GatCAB subunit C [Propionibacteriales bacterium]